MTRRRLLGERVVVEVQGCRAREGVLISGVAKLTKTIKKFPVRFPNGDVRTYCGNQLLLRGSQAPLLEFIRVGDIIFTKSTLGVVRFIGLHEDFVGTIIVVEPIDPKLPSDSNVESFRKLFPSANLSDNRAYNIVRQMDEILKILPPDTLLQQLSKIKDKYLAYAQDSREKDRAFEEDMNKWTQKIAELEEELNRKNEDMKVVETSSDAGASLPLEDSNMKRILFQPGRLGIKAKWSTGEVEGVSTGAQAERLGVKAFWMIVKIDDENYSEDKLDLKTNGNDEYTLTFQTHVDDPEKTKVNEAKTLVEPIPSNEYPLTDMLTQETVRERYEGKIHELTQQIEDFKYAVESLQEKNLNMEKEHEQLPKLREKVGQLRNSRVVFKGQIKEFQKRLQQAKQEADLNEKKLNQRLVELQSGGKNSPQNQVAQDAPGRNEGPMPVRPRKHQRKASVTMPKPTPSNTVSLGGKPVPKIGDGSAETVSLFNLNQQPAKVADSKNPKKNKGVHRLRSPFFGGKKSTGNQEPRRG